MVAAGLRETVIGNAEILPPDADSSYDSNIDVRHLTASEELNAAVQHLFDELNRRLFIPHLKNKQGNLLGEVPECILTVQSTGRCKGFMARAQWSNHRGRYLDQITLVFEKHAHGDTRDVGQTMAHEMVHAVQLHKGKPGKGNYHNRQFSDWMKSIGLQTSQTGKPGGAEIGTGMSDYIISGGPFDRVMNDLTAEGFQIPWEAVRALPSFGIEDDPGETKPKDPSKVKFTCSVCRANAWAKQTARLVCGVPACGLPPMTANI